MKDKPSDVFQSFYRAAEVGNEERVQVLAHEHHSPGDPNSPLLGRDEGNKTLLMVAAARGHHQLVRRFIHLGLDASAIDKKGNNALHELARAHHIGGRKVAEDTRFLQAAVLLMEAGCNPWIMNTKCQTAVDVAVESGSICLKIVLESKAFFSGELMLPVLGLMKGGFGKNEKQFWCVVAPRMTSSEPTASLWMSCYKSRDKCPLLFRIPLADATAHRIVPTGSYFYLRMGAGQVLPKKLDGGPSHELSVCPAGTTTKEEAAKLERLVKATKGFVTRESVSEQLLKKPTPTEPTASNGQAQDPPGQIQEARLQPAATPPTSAAPAMAAPLPRFHSPEPAAAQSARPATHLPQTEPPRSSSATWPPAQNSTLPVARSPAVVVPLPWRAPPIPAVAALDRSRDEARGSSVAPNAARLVPPQWTAPLPNSRPAVSEPRDVPAERGSPQNMPAEPGRPASRAAIPMDRIPVRMAPMELPSSPPGSPLRSPVQSPPNSPPSSAPIAPGHQPEAMTCNQRMEAQERQWTEAAVCGRGERQPPRSSEPVAVPRSAAADDDSEWRRAVELHLAQLEDEKLAQRLQREEYEAQKRHREMMDHPTPPHKGCEASLFDTDASSSMGALSFAEQPSAPPDLLDSYPSSLLEARPSQPFAQSSCSSLAATSDTGSAAGRRSKQDYFEDSLCCPITHEVMVDPVVLLGDGMTYERAAIAKWLDVHSTSPMTNQPLQSKVLVANHSLKSVIAAFQSQRR